MTLFTFIIVSTDISSFPPTFTPSLVPFRAKETRIKLGSHDITGPEIPTDYELPFKLID